MRQAADVGDFVAAPRCAYLLGDTFAFYNMENFCGWRVWGQPSRADAHQLVAAIGTAYAPGAPPYYSLVDLQGLERVDGPGFEVLQSFVRAHRDQMATQLLRQAVVRPTGMVGALASGFYVLLPPRHRVKVFDSLAPAARWLDAPDRQALEWLVTALGSAPAAAGPGLELKRWLGTQLIDATPAAAARALGLSVRTMQRQLKAAGTSFNNELKRARVEKASRLLVESSSKLSTIAQEVGFSSSQQLATSFREIVELTPSEFRRRYHSAGVLKAGRAAR